MRRPGGARAALLALMLVAAPALAQARVMVLFHSFNGSMFHGRYPHAFVELTGTIDGDGRAIHENYGYSAVGESYGILMGQTAPGRITIEEDRYLKTTNVHFAVPISDAQYTAIRAEIERWRAGPENPYNIETHNCVNFVARIAELVGLRAQVPRTMEKRPKAWLNYLIGLNPQLHAKPVN